MVTRVSQSMISGKTSGTTDLSTGDHAGDLVDLGTYNTVANVIDPKVTRGGVQLGGTGAANLLSDYEEGTFIATATPGTSGTITLTDATLSYTKVGQLVFVSGNLTINALSSPVGSINLTAMPFTASVDAVANVNIQDPVSGDISFTGWLLTGANTTLKIYENTGTQPAAAAELLKTTSTIYISLTYITSQ